MATDKLGREFSFDTLASEIVSSVTVHKQSQATMQSGGIGATIDVHTAKPFLSRNAALAASKCSMILTRNNMRLLPLLCSATLIWITHWHSSLFYSTQASSATRRSANWWLVGKYQRTWKWAFWYVSTLYVPRNYDQRVRFDDRTRSWSALVLQYRPNNKLELCRLFGVDIRCGDFKSQWGIGLHRATLKMLRWMKTARRWLFHKIAGMPPTFTRAL